ncbi:MAG: GTP-binding protein, partial [Promethearchaeota archaeon]
MKIVIAGPFQSGKSSLVKALDPNALNVSIKNRAGQNVTVGMDLGKYNLNGLELSIFGTPGLLRFSAMRRIILEGCDGILFLFDGVNADKDEGAIQILNEIKRSSVLSPKKMCPIVYAVNKADMETCRSIEVVKEQNYFYKQAPFFSISAKRKENILEPLKTLIEMIKENYHPMIEILKEFEQGDLYSLQEKLNIEDQEKFIELLNALEIRHIISLDRSSKRYIMNEQAQ